MGTPRFDFWQELNEHLLGHIFEQSLSDIVELKAGKTTPLGEKLAERKRHGIYYTSQILSDFLAASAIRALLDEEVPLKPTATDADAIGFLERRLKVLLALRIVDLAAGSGAFLVSAYREQLMELHRLQEALAALRAGAGTATQASLDVLVATRDQSNLLRESLFGADLLPQAVEIAKLALWLRSARKGELVADLGNNIVVADSLDVGELLKKLKGAPGSFDLVIGNPPWGGKLDPKLYKEVCDVLSVDRALEWDSWELFVLLALHCLRNGGRMALVLPDTIFSPEKERTRRVMVDSCQIEKLHSLGPGWFGKDVRMGTVVIQVRKGLPSGPADFHSVLLTGDLRKRVQAGELPLTQVEATFGRSIPQERCQASPTAEIEIFRARRDDDVMHVMNTNSLPLSGLCNRARGEEMSKAGLLWECPSCMKATVPGAKKKGGGYHSKKCPSCGTDLSEVNTKRKFLVEARLPTSNGKWVPFIDGDDITRRYKQVDPRKKMRADVADWKYKPESIYQKPKILIRQAGVGLFATLDETDAYCPQSIYIYRVAEDAAKEGYALEYALAALSSRTMAYYVFKRFSEVDPDRAHAKLTHARLATLPIPRVDFSDSAQKKKHDEIVERVRRILAGKAKLGDSDDLEIELSLRELWGLTGADGEYINGEFAHLPDSQIIRDLFPNGRPRPVPVAA